MPQFSSSGYLGAILRFSCALLLLYSAGLASAEVLRVAIISDLNGSYGSTHYDAAVDAAISRIVKMQPELVISTGDMVAGQRRPHLLSQQIESMWRAFNHKVSQPLDEAGIPLVATPGNHDASAYAGFERERQIYRLHWEPAKPDLNFIDDSGYPFYYAFELQGVLFVSLDATIVGQLPVAQLNWLKSILQRAGTSYKKRVVYSHLPLWPTAQGRESEYIGDQKLQSLLEDSGVDVFLSGHHHAFYPAAKSGVAFIGQACLGAGPRRLIGTHTAAQRSFTLLDFSDEDIKVSAFAAPDFTQVIRWDSLPEYVRSPVAELQRLDKSSIRTKVLEGTGL